MASFIYAIYSGKIAEVNNDIFDSCKDAVNLSLILIGNMCFWCGIMNTISKTSIRKKINKLLSPIINKLFPDIKNENIKNEISMNIIANILGLGNAATPLGLKAMNSMQNENKNKDVLSNSMAMFIVINTASLQIIPTTAIAMRSNLGSQNPTKIIISVWISTIVALFVAIILCQILIKKIR
jgi:spore maturation protein A